MSTITAPLLILKKRPRIQPQIIPDGWWAAKWTFALGQEQWFVSHKESIPFLPAGADVIHGISSEGFTLPRQSINVEGSRSPASSAAYTYVDLNGSISDLIALKYANEEGTKNRIHQIYRWPVGERIDELTEYSADLDKKEDQYLLRTEFISDRQTGMGKKEIQCVDIKRESKKSILDPRSWRLVDSLKEETPESIIIHGDEPIYFQHNELYSVDPSKNIAYIQTPEREIISFTGHESIDGDRNVTNNLNFPGSAWRLHGVTRGAFNTTPQENIFGDDGEYVKLESRPEVTEWTFFEEKTPDFIQGLMCGYTTDGRLLPDHWQAGIDIKWLDIESFIAHEDLRVLRWHLENYGKTGFKELCEKEVMAFIPGAFIANPFGQLQLHRFTSVAKIGGDRVVFDLSNVATTSVGELETKNSNLVNAIRLKYGWNAWSEVFETKPPAFVDTSSIKISPGGGTLTLESKLMHDRVHTNSQINNLVSVIGDVRFHERSEIKFIALSSTYEVQLGDRVRVNFTPPGGHSLVRDDSTNAPGSSQLNRSMVVIAKEPKPDGGIEYTCYATKQRASIALGGVLTRHILDSVYAPSDVLMDLSLVLPIVEVGGVWLVTIGTYDIPIRAYTFIKGPLIVPDGVVINGNNFGRQLEIWCNHPFEFNGIINVAGMGINKGGEPGKLGDYGYCVPVHAGGNLVMRYTEGNTIVNPIVHVWSTARLYYQDFTGGDMPPLALSNNGDGDVLSGLARNLAGYGGPGSGEARLHTSGNLITPANIHRQSGYPGARSGAGIRIVSPAPTFGGNCKLITSGADALPPVFFTTGRSVPVYLSAGAGGGPGAVEVLVDGALFPLTDISQHCECFVGLSPIPGKRLESLHEWFILSSGGANIAGDYVEYRSHLEPSPNENMAEACTRMSRIPPPEIVQRKTISDFGIEREQQLDLQIELYVNNAQPSNPNDRDLWITESELASDTKRPVINRFSSLSGTWTEIEWPNTTAYVLLQAERKYGIGDGIKLFYEEPTGDYRPTDLYHDATTDTFWRLGPPRVLVTREEFGYYTADSFLADGNFLKWMAGYKTLYFGEDTTVHPTQNMLAAIPGPGETNDAWTTLNGSDTTERTVGSIDWTTLGGTLKSVSTTLAGDGIAYTVVGYAGFLSDVSDRQIWIDVRADNPGLSVKVQSGGVLTTAGDPSLQAEHQIQNVSADFKWEKMTAGATGGLFKALADHIQVRTIHSGIRIRNILLLAKESTSMPVGTTVFTVPPLPVGTPRLRYPTQVINDFHQPFPWVQVGADLGDNMSPGVVIEAETGSTRFVCETYTFPVHAGRQYHFSASVRFDNMVIAPSGIEGFALDIAVYDIDGLVTFSNAVGFTVGEWFHNTDNEFSFFSQIIDIPEHTQGIVSCSVRYRVKGISGSVSISEAKVREITRRIQEEQTQTLTFTNPFLKGVVFPQINTRDGLLASETWITPIRADRIVDVAFSADCVIDIAGCRINLVLEGQDAAGATVEVITSTGPLDLPAGSTKISLNARKIAKNRIDRLAFRIYMLVFPGSPANNIPNSVRLDNMDYQMGHDEELLVTN